MFDGKKKKKSQCFNFENQIFRLFISIQLLLLHHQHLQTKIHYNVLCLKRQSMKNEEIIDSMLEIRMRSTFLN